MRVALLSIVLLFAGCIPLQRGYETAITTDPDTGMTPAGSIAKGVTSMVSNPINPVAWGDIITGVGAILVGAFGIGTGVALKKAAKAEKDLHNMERIDQMKKVKNGVT